MPWIFSERLTCVRPLAALRPENAPNKLPLEVPKALLGDHYRHRFDLVGMCATKLPLGQLKLTSSPVGNLVFYGHFAGHFLNICI